MIVLKNIKKMSKIPTAEKFLTISDEFEVLETRKQEEVVTKTMIEFAKLHVEAALKEAEIAGQNNWGNSKKMKDAILNVYPLENIK